MKKAIVIIIMAMVLISSSVFADQGITVKDNGVEDFQDARPEVVESWQDMRFGMFLCWGPVSLTGQEISWSRGVTAWGYRPGVITYRYSNALPSDDYDNLYKAWKPDKFDAEDWVKLAKDAGMKYMVFLVKHHDGFSLYDTKLSDYKSTGPESAWKVDVMKQVADACHKHGLKLIVYYSQPDWHHPDYFSENHDRYIEYLHGQIRELLTNYGRIDGLWFDNLRGIGDKPEVAKLWRAEELVEMARSIQPHLIINNRCGLSGDYDTPEQSLGVFEFDRPWEACVTLGTQWSWKPDDSIKSLKESIDILVTCAGRGGNLALNTNPMPNGQIEARQAKRFREIGSWLKKYGASIYGTRGGPYVLKTWGTQWNTTTSTDARPWGVTTWKDSSLYVHILNWTKDKIELSTIDRKLVSYRSLTGGKAKVVQTEEGLTITMPVKQRDPLDTIIELKFDRSLVGIGRLFTGKRSLAFGCNATASGVWPGYGPELAFDNNHGTRWAGADDGSKAGWLAVELRKPMKFSKVRIHEGSDRIRKFELQIKKNDKWQTIHSGTTVGEDYSAKFKPVTAQHVRLNILEATNVPTIWEIELFNE